MLSSAHKNNDHNLGLLNQKVMHTVSVNVFLAQKTLQHDGKNRVKRIAHHKPK